MRYTSAVTISRALFSRLEKSAAVAVFLLALSFSHLSLGSEADLKRFMSEVDTLSADFQQLVFDESGRRLSDSSGILYLARPGRFRWDYFADQFEGEGSGSTKEKQIGQQIVADGTSIYMFDPDLEQVTKRSMDDALNQVPALTLVQTRSVLDEHFLLSDIGMTDGLSWVGLKPKAENAGYQQLMIGFDSGSLSSIVLLDGIGNETRLTLSRVAVNEKIESQWFDFIVPAGADVLED